MAKTIKRAACEYCKSSNNLCFWEYEDREYSKCQTPNCDYNKQTKPFGTEKTINTINDYSNLITTGVHVDLKDRGISVDTCQRYKYQVANYGGKDIHIANLVNSEGQVVAQKIRFIKTKEFIWQGDKNQTKMFGFHLCDTSNSSVFITEGEIDALTLSEIGINNVISLTGGAGSQTKAEMIKNQEYLEQFKSIVLVFDSDKVGQEAAKECAKIFTPGKVQIVSLRYKDPNEYLQQNKKEELLEDLEKRAIYCPESIKKPSKKSLLTPEPSGMELPYKQLNTMIRGVKPSRLYTLLAGSGVGKSSFTKEIVYNLLNNNEDLKVGLAYLEEPLDTTGQSFIALDNDIPLFKLAEQPDILPEDKFDASYNKLIKNQRINFLDASFMKLTGQDLIYNLNYLIEGFGCNLIILDHLTMITYDMGDSSERKDIDMLMKNLRELVHKTKATVIVVCHLKRPFAGKSWAEGREVNMADARGSSSIEQVSDVILALERNMIDESEKGKTRTKVLKNRITGQTGYADELFYNVETGRLITVDQLFK